MRPRRERGQMMQRGGIRRDNPAVTDVVPVVFVVVIVVVVVDTAATSDGGEVAQEELRRLDASPADAHQDSEGGVIRGGLPACSPPVVSPAGGVLRSAVAADDRRDSVRNGCHARAHAHSSMCVDAAAAKRQQRVPCIRQHNAAALPPNRCSDKSCYSARRAHGAVRLPDHAAVSCSHLGSRTRQTRVVPVRVRASDDPVRRHADADCGGG